MRMVKWISPLIVGLGLVNNTQVATAGLAEVQPGACKPVQKVEPLPPACQPVHAYSPQVKPCEAVQAAKTCEPVRKYEVDRLPFLFEHLGHKVDRVLHVAAYKLHAWVHEGYTKEYSPAPCDPVAPVSAPPASAPTPLPVAPAPAPAGHS